MEYCNVCSATFIRFLKKTFIFRFHALYSSTCALIFPRFLPRYFKRKKNLVQLNKLQTSMHTFTLHFISRQPKPIIANVLDTKVFSYINPIKKYQAAQELTPNYCFHIHPANTLTISRAAERLHR